MNEVTKVASAQELKDRLMQIGSDFRAVAVDLVAAIDSGSTIKAELEELGVHRETISRLELIGRGQLDQRLMFAGFPAAKALKNLPLSTQAEVLEKGVIVMDDDEETTRLIPAPELMKAQVRVAFDREKVRTLAEQRTIIRAKKASKPPMRCDADATVKGQSVMVRVARVYTKQEVLGWLSQMK